MKYIFILFLSIIYFCSSPCIAQECNSVIVTKTPSATEYVRSIRIHYDSTVVNKFFRFIIGKYVVKSDTNFILSLGGLARGVLDKPNTQVVVLQFTDGYIITKPNQSINIIVPIGDALVSANVSLNKGDMLTIKDRLLASITLSDVKFTVTELASKSVREAVSCLPVVW